MAKMASRSVTSRAPRGWIGQVVGVGALGLMIFGLGWVVGQREQPALAQTPPPAAPPQVPAPSTDYTTRVVAYIYGNIPITREEMGEYLIARFGTDKLGLMVNKRIIEIACQKKGIEVSGAEIQADMDETVGALGCSTKDFLEKILRDRHMSLYEWKEDVVRPKLMLAKLCRDRVKIEQEDLQKAFESRYGEKIEAQVIMFPNDDSGQRTLMQVYEKIRKSDEEFDRQARMQPDPNLARVAGHIAPICRHTGLDQIEKIAFSLQPGEISQQIGTPQGMVILKCIKRRPPEEGRTMEKEREALIKEVTEKKIQQTIPMVMKELTEEAKPNFLLKGSVSEKELREFTEHEVKTMQNEKKGTPAVVPHGN
jgi:hypothetical protein